MVNLKQSELRFIDEIFNMGSGYVLDFSNRTFAEFFEDEFGVNIYQEKYQLRGTSKANHLRSFIEAEDGSTVGKMLRKLLEHRDIIYASDSTRYLSEGGRSRFLELLNRIEAGNASPVLAHLSGKAEFVNFDTVSRDLDRALASAKNDPEDAVTSACSTVEKRLPLNS